MTGARRCWDWPDLLTATQIDAGATSVGDPKSDAVFLAVHQPVPFGRFSGERVSIVREHDLLVDFERDWEVNEPLLVFVTGDVGTGKSHMVRWLRSSIGDRPDWHVVYIEKRNTSLTRVIEKVIDGLESDSIRQIRAALHDARSEWQTLQQAQLRLLNELRVLVETDHATSVRVRSADHEEIRLDGPVLKTARECARVLIGDLQLSDYLQRPDGPIERITKLAMPRSSALDDDVEESDVRLDERDLIVDLQEVDDLNQAASEAVFSLGNQRLRTAVAQLLDHYLPQAKARVFAGRNTDLLELFAEVRREIENRGQQLCLFIEDLVLLHGIDQELAQALTIPAGSGLCRVRAAIAVTSGYLRNVDTFNDRGTHFTMDVATSEVTVEDRRSFVARYLNVARVGLEAVADAADEVRISAAPNGCSDCPVRPECHKAFEASAEGYGYFPFNQHALDYLISLVSDQVFRPREILRQVIRAGVEVADNELRTPHLFPSKQFAANLDQNRRKVPVALQQQLEKSSPTPEQECTLRNFYSDQPPAVTEGLTRVAHFLGLELDEVAVEVDKPPIEESTNVTDAPKQSVFERWYHDEKFRLPAQKANEIRSWFFNQLHVRLEAGDHGHLVTRKGNVLIVGGVTVSRDRSFVIARAGGGGTGVVDGPQLRFEPTTSNALLFQNIELAERRGASSSDGGAWYFQSMDRLDELERDVVTQADHFRKEVDAAEAVTVLRLLSRLTDPSTDAIGLDVAGLFRRPIGGDGPARTRFVNDTDRMRRNALDTIRLSFTQAQGGGASSILDAGGIYRELSATRRLSRIEGANVGGMLGALRGFHAKLTADSWRPIQEVFDWLAQHLDPASNLTQAWADMSELVNLANASGLLPYQDTKNRFEEALQGLADEAESSWRFVAEHRDADDLDSLVWELPADSLEHLRSLRRLVTECISILDHLDQLAERGERPAAAASRSSLSHALLELANLLDEVESA